MEGSFSTVTNSAEGTRIVGTSLASVVLPGDVVLLGGQLGSGKTVFVQGLAAGLGIMERVTSPTFTLHHQYRGRFTLSHVDVYRLESFQEVLDLGLDELIGNSILVVEWGDAIAPLLPRRRLEVRFEIIDEDTRQITFRAGSPEWARKLGTVRTTVEALLAASAPLEPADLADSPPNEAPTRDDMGSAPEPREEDGKE